MADVDQAVVDEILAKAAEDTEEGRLEKLEKEVETLKGSIKRLLLDIRETMNRLENPFANLQSLAEANIVPQSAPQIQIVPTNIPLVGEEGEKGEEEFQEETGKDSQEFEEKEEEKQSIEELGKIEDRSEDGMKVMQIAKPKELKEEREGEKIDNLRLITDTKKNLDFITFFNLMDWVQGMIAKHSYEAFKLILEVFEMAGYVRSDTKELILKLADLVKFNGAKEVLIELYKLNRVFNPGDRSLDSDLLALLLDKR
ncbi:MAG: hypothetical protein QXQ38_04485 [Archaeoglobaceae archaeon]|nr:hypothetical protein [Archaeoglobales archaeon]